LTVSSIFWTPAWHRIVGMQLECNPDPFRTFFNCPDSSRPGFSQSHRQFICSEEITHKLCM